MKSSMAWAAGQCWRIAAPVLAATVALAGCIPSEPEVKPIPVTSAPTASQTAPISPSPATKTAPVALPPATTPPVQTQSVPPPSGDRQASTIKINSSAEPNASVAVEPKKDGAGFNVRGTFNLEGTIVPNGPGKWKFAGQFSVAEADFAVGNLSIMPMAKLAPVANGNTTQEDNIMIMIDIPVRPPAAPAPEGSAKRSVPVSLDIDAPEKADFTVSLTQM